MMRKWGLVVLAFVVWPNVAEAVYLTYSQWEAMPPFGRDAYIAGAFDSLVEISASSNDNYQKHYNSCLVRQQMTNGQLADNVRAYAASRPELQTGGVVGAMLNYLIALCGKPPSQ